MTLNELLARFGLAENPFRGEEARNDAVFAKMTSPPAVMAPTGNTPPPGTIPLPGMQSTVSLSLPTVTGTFHSDFEKILGDLGRPATAIVFGEKGSGKTAIRLQITRAIDLYNSGPGIEKRVLLLAYDDLNGVLDRFHARVNGKSALESFQKLRLVDHLDALLAGFVPRLVDAVLGKGDGDGLLREEAKKALRKLDDGQKRDLLLLQALYDRPEQADLRTTQLRKKLGIWKPLGRRLWQWAAWLGWIPAGALVYWYKMTPGEIGPGAPLYAFLALVGLWLIVIGKATLWDKITMNLYGKRVRKQVRVLSRGDRSYARSLFQLDPVLRDEENVPTGDSDEVRYRLFDRMRNVLKGFGYAGVVIIIDRVDEPTLISGDYDRMRAVVWPMLNNKFLQQEGVGVKMLLPVELRYALYKESAAFFQEARLDKQNMVDRLSWTGAMLYDLCTSRLHACLAPGATPLSLLDLFSEEVTRSDLVDALDQMHQPRDAFKFLYRCMAEHCSNVTKEDKNVRIPKAVLDMVRKQEAERVQQLYRGIRPA
ncbi:MAG: hypothetical protein U0573_13385 [Phycisphaerales bacterium]|nr:hypothetical protein [Planctomycetota bacterium]